MKQQTCSDNVVVTTLNRIIQKLDITSITGPCFWLHAGWSVGLHTKEKGAVIFLLWWVITTGASPIPIHKVGVGTVVKMSWEKGRTGYSSSKGVV